MILWGPPGCGKTTVARLLAAETKLEFEQLSAIFSGVQDLRKAFDRAKIRREQGKGTLLFVDEIHRFNRAQQDSFLPYMEDGTITLVGATTENPSFELNAAVLSRATVLVFNRLGPDAIEGLLARAEQEEGRPLLLDPSGRAALIAMADGMVARRSISRTKCSPRFPQVRPRSGATGSSRSSSAARRSTTRARIAITT